MSRSGLYPHFPCRHTIFSSGSSAGFTRFGVFPAPLAYTRALRSSQRSLLGLSIPLRTLISSSRSSHSGYLKVAVRAAASGAKACARPCARGKMYFARRRAPAAWARGSGSVYSSSGAFVRRWNDGFRRWRMSDGRDLQPRLESKMWRRTCGREAGEEFFAVWDVHGARVEHPCAGEGKVRWGSPVFV